MAGSRSAGMLQVSKCHCETGRQRVDDLEAAFLDGASEQSSVDELAAAALDILSDEDEDDEEDDDGDDEDEDEDGNDAAVDGLWVDGEDSTELAGPGPDGNSDADGAESSEEAASPSAWGRVPEIATWRINLTALSQRYNIYAVVFRHEVHIFRPRSCVTHSLPCKPDLILPSLPSAEGSRVGGYMDKAFPHQANHMIVGEFGDEEVLLLAHDDGDVIGYYTRHIEDELVHREQSPITKASTTLVSPFFYQNVGKSAWGLAVHKKSRLIAVGSNKHEAVVFAPALAKRPGKVYMTQDSIEVRKGPRPNEEWTALIKKKNTGKKLYTGDINPKFEHLLRARQCELRVILTTGVDGQNIPNLTFSNDEHGNAEKVVAVDIGGSIWLMDIWNRTAHVVIPPTHRHSRNPMGWGVVVLPESNFMPTAGPELTLGLMEQDFEFLSTDTTGHWIDATKGMEKVRCTSGIHPWLRSREGLFHNLFEGRVAMHNSFGWHATDSMTTRSRFLKERARAPVRARPLLGDGSSILRLYETDIELQSFEEDGVGCFIQGATYQMVPSPALAPGFRHLHQRLSNVLAVPELSLVIAGSGCGRVALITLTRPETPICTLKRGFRVDAILPTMEEEDRGLRPQCPLLGVACGPIPLSGGDEHLVPKGMRKYRLMLHYWDMRILSYEISRATSSDEWHIT